MLQFMIGRGLSGVEFSAELADYIVTCTREYNLNPDEVEIILIEAAERIVPHMDESFSEHIIKKLREKGRIVTGTATVAIGSEQSLCGYFRWNQKAISSKDSGRGCQSGKASCSWMVSTSISKEVHVYSFSGKSSQVNYLGEAHTAVKERAPQLGELLRL